ncbi:hypothetical protein HDU97_002619 [Phlyctochytrium planicorne]|nr:hypothetical protein HDU97_002619 [Phlyctochytrium planicorne]
MSTATPSIATLNNRTNGASVGDEDDVKRLKQLGYKQELARGLYVFSNFGITFTILSEPLSVLPLMYLGLLAGGPQGMLVTWPIITVLTLFPASSMSEIISSYPTSGGLYYWAASLAGPKWAPFASYMTGYFNSLGLVGLCSGSAYAFGQFFTNILSLAGVESMDTAIVGESAFAPKIVTLVAAWASLALGAGLAVMPSRKLDWIGKASFWFNVAGLFGIVIGCFATSKTRVPVADLYKNWNNGTGLPDSMAIVISILLATLTFTGYDSAGHLAEETKNPSVTGPRSIFYAIAGTFIGGYLALLGLLSTIPPDTYTDLGNQGSYALTQIFINTIGTPGAIVFNVLLMFLAITNIFGLLLTHARQTFAFSRDGALPGSNWLHKLNSHAVPERATWMIVLVDAIILIPSLYSATLYYAINSFGVVGTYMAYAVPILLRVVNHKRFPVGSFNLGVWGVPVGAFGIAFLVTASIVIMLPTVYTNPDDFTNEDGELDRTEYIKQYLKNFNWAPAMVFTVISVSLIFWFASASKWFKGPPIDVLTVWKKMPDQEEGSDASAVETEVNKEEFIVAKEGASSETVVESDRTSIKGKVVE